MKLKLTLKLKLTVIIMAVVIIPSVFLGYTATQKFQEETVKSLQNNTQELAKGLAISIDEFLLSRKQMSKVKTQSIRLYQGTGLVYMLPND